MADLNVGGRIPDMPSVLDRIEHALRSVTGTRRAEGVWHPTVDIYDKEGAIVAEVELPGMKGKDLNVSLEENHLIIEGRRARPEEHKEAELYYAERPTGDFHRIIHLPENVDRDATEAKYEDGVLTVTMPKAERARGRKIQIT